MSLSTPRLAALCLVASLGLSAGRVEDEREGPPNVLLWVASGLRADHVGTYGYARATTPKLDALAARAVVFEDAHAQAPGTVPAMTSLFTSLPLRVHGFEGRDRAATEHARRAMPEGLPLLAELFRKAGYLTAGWADGGNVSEAEGFDRGFEHFESQYRLAQHRTEEALDFLQSRDRSRPFFLFVQTFQTTSPYLPSAERLARFADPAYDGPLKTAWQRAVRYRPSFELKSPMASLHKTHYAPLLSGHAPSEADRAFVLALYDACVLTCDEQLGRLVEYLERLGELDRTVIVVTADHGVELWEHGAYGQGALYEENLRVPLVIRAPGVPPGRSTAPAEQIDVLPTLLGLAGIPIPEHAQGLRLDLACRETADPARPRFAEGPGGRVAVRIGAAKFQLDGEGPPELYLLDRDPREERNLASEPATERLGEARRQLEAWSQACEALREGLGLVSTPR